MWKEEKFNIESTDMYPRQEIDCNIIRCFIVVGVNGKAINVKDSFKAELYNFVKYEIKEDSWVMLLT